MNKLVLAVVVSIFLSGVAYAEVIPYKDNHKSHKDAKSITVHDAVIVDDNNRGDFAFVGGINLPRAIKLGNLGNGGVYISEKVTKRISDSNADSDWASETLLTFENTFIDFNLFGGN